MLHLTHLAAEQNRCCFYCKQRFTRRGPGRATRDHYRPQWAGGGDEPENIVIACARCNGLKGPIMPEEFIRLLASGDRVALRRAYNSAKNQATQWSRTGDGTAPDWLG